MSVGESLFAKCIERKRFRQFIHLPLIMVGIIYFMEKKIYFLSKYIANAVERKYIVGLAIPTTGGRVLIF